MDNKDEISDFPQVGPYVLNSTLCFGFDEERPIMDTNVERIYSCLFQGDSVNEYSTDKVWELAEQMLSEGQARRYNFALLDFGYSLCTCSSPSYESRFATEYCDYYQNQTQEE